MTRAPAYPASEGDRREIDVLGLRLPWRATLAVVVVTLVVLADHSRSFLPDALDSLGRTPPVLLITAIERLLLFGSVPLAVVVLVFRERPSRYGLAIGDWTAGLALTLVGCVAMTPLVLWFATFADVQAYYAPGNAPLPGLLISNAIDLASAEFLFRGFLTFTLLRAIGPVGVLVATMPFIYSHFGKPELELYSTLAGGLVYGWLAWRTRSILWGTIGHIYILTLVIVAAAAAAAAPLPAPA
ncbi:MAG: protease family protein [Chloroflexota bacterium]|nr:protease family protein [Chloroflexota bacterium]